MDNLQVPCGRISVATVDSQRVKHGERIKDERTTLMKLKKLVRTVMSKSERHCFEAKKLQRSNIVRFLGIHLTNSSDNVRLLVLELFCCTIPRLANKTDALLKPLLVKFFQCLQKEQKKEIKLKTLQFLRTFFRHSKSLSGFIASFIEIGIKNLDAEIQIACCVGLNIVFDQDIGSNLYSPLVISVANLMVEPPVFDLTRAAYRALKHIHKTIKDDRFFEMINQARPEAVESYKSMYYFEETDSFLTFKDTDLSGIVKEYQIKRCCLKQTKDFGILDPILLHKIRETKNCERAKAVSNLLVALKTTSWSDKDLDQHVLDFLILVKGFAACQANRLIQSLGYDILKEIITRMGFLLSPHINWVIDILRDNFTSENPKLKSKVEMVLYHLMRDVHPMTVTWNLLNTRDASLKAAVILFIKNILGHFEYYEIDMVALCNWIGYSLEDNNVQLAKCSRDCIISLLDKMRDCPTYGMREQAVRVLIRNHTLSPQTLKDIGILGYSQEDDDYEESFETYSDTETSDTYTPSLPFGSVTDFSTAMSTQSSSYSFRPRTYILTENNACSDINQSCETLCKSEYCYRINKRLNCVAEFRQKTQATNNLNKIQESNNDKQLREDAMPINIYSSSNNNSQTSINCEENQAALTNKVKEDDVYSSDTATIEELFSPNSGSTRRTYICSSENQTPDIAGEQRDDITSPDSFENVKLNENSSAQLNSNGFGAKKDSGLSVISQEKHFIENGSGISQLANILVSENVAVLQQLNSGRKPSRRYFTNFCMKSDSTHSVSPPQKIFGDHTDAVLKNSPLALPPDHKFKTVSNIETSSHQEKYVQTNQMDRNYFNFNSFKIQKYSKDLECTESSRSSSNMSLNKAMEIDVDKSDTLRKTQCVLEDKLKSQRRPPPNEEVTSELSSKIPYSQSTVHLQKVNDCNIHEPPREFESPTESMKDGKVHQQKVVDSNLYKQTKMNFESANESTDERESCLITEENIELPCKHSIDIPHCQIEVHPQKVLKYRSHKDSLTDLESTNGTMSEKESLFNSPATEKSFLRESGDHAQTRESCYETEDSVSLDVAVNELADRRSKETEMYDVSRVNSNPDELSADNFKIFEDVDAPFMPKSRQLPRTPPEKTNTELSLEIRPKISKNKKQPVWNKRKTATLKIQEKKGAGECAITNEQPPKMSPRKSSTAKGKDAKVGAMTQNNSTKSFERCPWRRDLEFAAKTAPCTWARKFEKDMEAVKPFASSNVADKEMRKTTEDLNGNSLKKKQEAMLAVIQIAKHHPEVIQEYAPKTVLALSKEIKNFSTVLAGKAILTVGRLYQIMGQKFENHLQPVIKVLLEKSGNRTLATYSRLVIKSLFQVVKSTSPQKVAAVLIAEVYQSANKAAKETSAQFLTILTKDMGPENSFAPTMSGPMLRCAVMFATESSALTRYCGKRMLETLMTNPDFDKLKDHLLNAKASQELSEILEQMKHKEMTEEILPINLIYQPRSHKL